MPITAPIPGTPGATGPAGPAPAGTGLVAVTAGVLATPIPIPWSTTIPVTTTQTTDATVTTIASIDFSSYGGGMVSAFVAAHNTAKTVACAWTITASVTNSGGTVTLVDSVSEPTDPVSALACALDVSGTNVRIRVTGVASGGDPNLNVNWCCSATAVLHGSP